MTPEVIAVYAIVTIFADWDDCWNYAHKADLTKAYIVCQPVEVERPSLAPTTSLRPKQRPEGWTHD